MDVEIEVVTTHFGGLGSPCLGRAYVTDDGAKAEEAAPGICVYTHPTFLSE